MVKNQLLYKDFARYYDLIYSGKNYKEESAKIDRLIKKYKKSKGKKLLDVACGSGKHLQYFSKKYSCTGIDLNKEILDESKKRLKKVKFKQKDMINFKLNQKFDIITCLFSSIGYVKTYDNLKKSLKNFYTHLNKGGIILIQPWFTKSQWNNNTSHLQTYEDEKIKIARMVFSSMKRKNISVMEMHYLIGEDKKGVKHFVEKHEMGLFEVKESLKIMNRVGFDAKYLSKFIGRGVYVGVKNGE